jgi:hypothetical protein
VARLKIRVMMRNGIGIRVTLPGFDVRGKLANFAVKICARRLARVRTLARVRARILRSILKRFAKGTTTTGIS